MANHPEHAQHPLPNRSVRSCGNPNLVNLESHPPPILTDPRTQLKITAPLEGDASAFVGLPEGERKANGIEFGRKEIMKPWILWMVRNP